MNKILKFTLLLAWIAMAIPSAEAQKNYYQSLREAIFSAGELRGSSEPSNVVWINGGSQYSFTKFNQGKQEIWIHDIESGEETLVFSADNKTFPDGSDFRYRSFQWAGNYNYILFQTQFTPIWRYSGNADYYYYSLQSDDLELIVEQAFTAEVSPDGKKLAFGKDGDLFMYTF